jgi:insertion element IS1 protein InsB
MIKQLNNEGVSISSISRLLKIAKSSVLKIIELLAGKITKPKWKEKNQQYEIDELWTYIKRKDNECWIIYSINKITHKVIDFTVGSRKAANIRKVVDAVLQLNPKQIFTDRLNIYPNLIPAKIHTASSYRINHIERKNLDLRKDLKCLNRQTICYSKSEKMLANKLQLYFFG